MRKIVLFVLFVAVLGFCAEIKPRKSVSACVINANESYISACINGVRYALEAQLGDTLYNEYSLKPIFVGTEYSKCSCSIEKIRKRVTKTRVKEQITYDYDPHAWKITLLKEPTPTKEAIEGLKRIEAQPKKPKLKTGIICVKC